MLPAETPPPPLDPRDIPRIEHTRLRRRLLSSCYRDDVVDRVARQLGPVRAAVIGEPDLTANPYLSLWTQVAVLYQDEPRIAVESGSAEVVTAAADAGLWPLQQRNQRDTLALRNMVVAVELDEDGAVAYRPVYPDMVVAKADRRRPSVPLAISEARYTPTVGWCWYTHDISGPVPTYTVADANGRDVTIDVLGGDYSGERFPCFTSSGVPRLPFGWYSAAETGWLFDPYTYREVVEGSLNIGVLLTYYQHLVRNAAWAQRYTVGARVKGVAPRGDGETVRQEVVTDPATVLQFEQDENATTALVGQWSPPVDPEAVLRSISAYERRILLLAGLQPPDVTRQEADVRSGYSLAVARESIREAQRGYEPVFRAADQSLLATTACLLNRSRGKAYSENPRDYRITYTGLPPTPQETAAKLATLKAKQDAGLVGPVSAYMELHPTATEDEAVIALAKVAVERTRVEEAVALLTRASPSAPQAVPLSVGAMQAAQQLVTAAAAGTMSAATVQTMLTSVIGLPPSAAADIAATIEPREAA